METTLNLNTQRMTSLEIAQVTGKQHKDVLKAIRNMEAAWVKVQGRNFALLQKTYPLPNGSKKMMPYYSLTKTVFTAHARQCKEIETLLAYKRKKTAP